MFFGERVWLYALLESHSKLTYQDWVVSQLQEWLYRDPDESGNWWYLAGDVSQLFYPAEIMQNLIKLDYLNIRVHSTNESDMNCRLPFVFEILHNLAYFVQIAEVAAAIDSGEDINVHEIVFLPEPRKWYLELVGDCGHRGDVVFLRNALLNPQQV